MLALQNELSRFGLALPDVLLPSEGINLERWAVIACDQFTSQPEYWEKVGEFVGSSPSTLEMILPEVYLGRPDVEERIRAVHAAMRRRLSDGTFRSLPATVIAVVRDTPHVQGRPGLMFAVDLERYDFSAGSRSLIRATEQTIVERLPVRVRVRTGAPLELPHILVLIDDPEASVIEPTVAAARTNPALYRSDLMSDGGSVAGYACDASIIETIFLPGLAALGAPERLKARYGSSDAPLFVMGDGNHSLASSKRVWENLKAGGAAIDSHPARWALVEIINLHSPQLPFEPIHRLLTGVTAADLFEFGRKRFGAEAEQESGFEAVLVDVMKNGSAPAIGTAFGLGSGRTWRTVRLPSTVATLPVAAIQTYLDSYCAHNAKARIDYIHGNEALASLTASGNAAGVLLPPIDRSRLIPTVLQKGVLPRKAFSLGEAEEKRYYFEARVIEGS